MPTISLVLRKELQSCDRRSAFAYLGATAILAPDPRGGDALADTWPVVAASGRGGTEARGVARDLRKGFCTMDSDFAARAFFLKHAGGLTPSGSKDCIS